MIRRGPPQVLCGTEKLPERKEGLGLPGGGAGVPHLLQRVEAEGAGDGAAPSSGVQPCTPKSTPKLNVWVSGCAGVPDRQTAWALLLTVAEAWRTRSGGSAKVRRKRQQAQVGEGKAGLHLSSLRTQEEPACAGACVRRLR